jgi:hypothetical protein
MQFLIDRGKARLLSVLLKKCRIFDDPKVVNLATFFTQNADQRRRGREWERRE